MWGPNIKSQKDSSHSKLWECVRSSLLPLCINPELVRSMGAETAVFLAGLKESIATEDDHHAAHREDRLTRDIQAHYDAHPGWHRYDPLYIEQRTGLPLTFQEIIVHELQERRLMQYQQIDGKGMIRFKFETGEPR